MTLAKEVHTNQVMRDESLRRALWSMVNGHGGGPGLRQNFIFTLDYWIALPSPPRLVCRSCSGHGVGAVTVNGARRG